MLCREKHARLLLWVMAVAALVAIVFAGGWIFNDPAHIARNLLETSGRTALTVKGNYSGEEMDERAKAMTQLPTYSMPFPLVWEYLSSAWKWDKNGAPTVPDTYFNSVDPSNLTQALPADYRVQPVADMLRGVWCGPSHPSDLACFVTYASNKEHLPKANGLPAQGFIPGHVFMWDSPGARNTLEFFTRYDTEFQFPRWAEVVTNTSESSIWSAARRPFAQLPYPVAVYEGFPNNPFKLYRMRAISGNRFWDPAVSSDPAVCYCSAHFDGNDTIVRNNFGREAYRTYRVLDGNGKKTQFWPQLETWAGGRRLVALKVPLVPETSCVGECFWWTLWRCILFYTPLLLLLCCCCSCPCVTIFWGCGKVKRRRRKNSGTTSEEEMDAEDCDDDDGSSELEALT